MAIITAWIHMTSCSNSTVSKHSWSCDMTDAQDKCHLPVQQHLQKSESLRRISLRGCNQQPWCPYSAAPMALTASTLQAVTTPAWETASEKNWQVSEPLRIINFHGHHKQPGRVHTICFFVLLFCYCCLFLFFVSSCFVFVFIVVIFLLRLIYW